MEDVKDYMGNVLEIGDDVVVMSSGNSSYRRGKVICFTKDCIGYPKVRVEYNDHYYCNRNRYELHYAASIGDPIKFCKKRIRSSVSPFNVIKLLPEYLED